MIKCQICGASAHVMKNHLMQMHGSGSEHPCTESEYQERFPEAPMLSQKALDRIAEMKAKRTGAVAAKGRPQIDEKADRAPLADLFSLGSDPEARTKSGKDIMIKVIQAEDNEELIPDMDPNYVYDIETLKVVLMGVENNIPTYIYGHAGVGKSSLFEQVCGATKRRLLRVQHTVNTEESHIVGQWVVKRVENDKEEVSTETVFELGPLPLAMLNGWTFLADEYDRAYPSVLSVYQAVLEGKALYIKEADAANRLIKPHPDFRFVATGNTNGAGDDTGMYQATVQQDAATFERFGVVHKVNYMEREKEIEIVQSQSGISNEFASKVVDFATRVRKMHPAELSLTIGPRVAINIARIGLMRGDFKKGVETAFANRLPEAEREAAIQVAQRLFG